MIGSPASRRAAASPGRATNVPEADLLPCPLFRRLWGLSGHRSANASVVILWVRALERLLRRKPEMHHVAVGDHVVLAFEPHLAGVARAGLAAGRYIVVICDGLGADEAALEVGVDRARGLRRACAARHRPGARFLRAGGGERHEMQQAVAGADQAIETGLLQPDVGEEMLALFARQHRQLRLGFCPDSTPNPPPP